MSSMTGYRQGDVVLIPFPFPDLSTFKQRPAVVISSEGFNRTHQDVVVAAITSHIPSRLESSDYRLEHSDLQSAGLPKPSLLKLGKIVTLDRRLIRKKLGSLPASTVAKVLAQLQNVF